MSQFLTTNGIIVILFKPQLELAKNKLGKKGIPINCDDVIDEIGSLVSKASIMGICFSRIIESPIKGNHGNVEFLLGTSDIVNPLKMCKIKDIVIKAYSM